jgi:ComEC/Rec2-related protein
MTFHYKHPLLYTAFFALYGVLGNANYFIVVLALLLWCVAKTLLTVHDAQLAVMSLLLGGISGHEHKSRFEVFQHTLSQGSPILVRVDEVVTLPGKQRFKTTLLRLQRGNFWYATPSFHLDIQISKASTMVPGSYVWLQGYTEFVRGPSNAPWDHNRESSTWGNQRLAQIKVSSSQVFLIKIDQKSPAFIRFWVKNYVTQRLKNRLSKRSMAWYEGLILGDKSAIETVDKEAFQSAGLMHILSVSGMHLALIYGLLSWPLKRMVRRFKASQYLEFLLLPVLWMYAYLTGFAPPVYRAALFITVFMISRILLKRKIRLPDILASALILQIALDPLICYSVSFQLSMAAMFGLAFWFPIWEDYIHPDSLLLKLMTDILGVSLACTLSTLPLTLYYFHSFPTWFLLGNILFTLPFTLIMYGFVALSLCVIVPFHIPIKLLANSINFCIEGIAKLLQTLHALPFQYFFAYDWNVVDVICLVALQIMVWRRLRNYPSCSFTSIKVMVLIWMSWGYVRVYWSTPSGEVGSQPIQPPKIWHETSRYLQSQHVDTIKIKDAF